LLAVPAPKGLPAQAQALLAGWNGRMAMDAPQPLIFQAWVDRFYLDLQAKLGAGGALAPLAEFLSTALSPAGAGFCGGNCTPLLTQALVEATQALAKRFGPDPAAWRWGAAHHAVFADPLLSRIPVLGAFARISIPVPGSSTTVFATASGPTGFTAVLGPEYRGVYDLADLNRSRFVMAPGESGNVYSPLARAFLHRWRAGQTVTLTSDVAHPSGRIHLSP
ncbi:MAG: penicillin acylase family protein, partial [Acetobacteraceae bacterium]